MQQNRTDECPTCKKKRMGFCPSLSAQIPTIFFFYARSDFGYLLSYIFDGFLLLSRARLEASIKYV